MGIIQTKNDLIKKDLISIQNLLDQFENSKTPEVEEIEPTPATVSSSVGSPPEFKIVYSNLSKNSKLC